MKPEEAIERLHQFLQQSIGIIEDADRGDDYAVKVKEDAEKDLSAIQLAIEALKEVQQYREIGTVEECREAVEKQKPKQVIIKEWSPTHCPTCNYELSHSVGDGYYKYPTFLKRCPNCGQVIQWGENLEGMEDE